MNDNHKFRKLIVWQRSMELTTLIYKITKNFPIEERYGLVDQIRRAVVSISLNIAEGSGAGSNLEYARFLRIAQRSAYELMAAIEISKNLKYLDTEADALLVEIDQVSAMISGLIKSLNTPDR